MNETELRREQAIIALQTATYALDHGDWDHAEILVRDVLLLMEATPMRDKHPEEPELDLGWRGEYVDMDNPLNQPAREY